MDVGIEEAAVHLIGDGGEGGRHGGGRQSAEISRRGCLIGGPELEWWVVLGFREEE